MAVFWRLNTLDSDALAQDSRWFEPGHLGSRESHFNSQLFSLYVDWLLTTYSYFWLFFRLVSQSMPFIGAWFLTDCWFSFLSVWLSSSFCYLSGVGYWCAKLCVGGMVPRSDAVVGCKMWIPISFAHKPCRVCLWPTHLVAHNINLPDRCLKAKCRGIKLQHYDWDYTFRILGNSHLWADTGLQGRGTSPWHRQRL